MQLNYFPYLSMSETDELDFTALNAKVWNYDRKADEYITDPSIKSQLDKIIRANVGRWYEVKNIGVVSVGDIDWREYSDEEHELCREVRLLLFIRSIASSGILERGANTGHYQFTTENFTLYTQNFSADNERMGILSGHIVRKSDYGFELSTVKFHKPDHVPTPSLFRGDAVLIADLLRLRKYQKKLYRRLLRAIEALSQAYVNDTSLNAASRIPILASAYESLFDLPEQGQRLTLKNYFRSHMTPTNNRRYRYSSSRPVSARYPRGYAWEIDDLCVMWVDKFYSLRNKIIHGSPVKGDDFAFRGKQDHFDIAVIFFILGMKKIMSEKPQIKDTIDEVHWKVHQEEEGEKYEGFAYDALDMFRGMRWS